jgi:hypothetical protein
MPAAEHGRARGSHAAVDGHEPFAIERVKNVWRHDPDAHDAHPHARFDREGHDVVGLDDARRQRMSPEHGLPLCKNQS